VNPFYLITVIAAALVLCNCSKNDETRSEQTQQAAPIADAASFARTAFESLARGEPDVANKIDWEVLISLDNNVGVRYIALTSEVEKEKFITGFITQFATSFRESGGKVEDFVNWRVTNQNDTWTEVASDSPNGDLTITIARREGLQRISTIRILK